MTRRGSGVRIPYGPPPDQGTSPWSAWFSADLAAERRWRAPRRRAAAPSWASATPGRTHGPAAGGGRATRPVSQAPSRPTSSGAALRASAGGLPQSGTGIMRAVSTSASITVSVPSGPLPSRRTRATAPVAGDDRPGAGVVEPGPPERGQGGTVGGLDLGGVEAGAPAVVGGGEHGVERAVDDADQHVEVEVGPRRALGQHEGGRGEAVSARVAGAPPVDPGPQGRQGGGQARPERAAAGVAHAVGADEHVTPDVGCGGRCRRAVPAPSPGSAGIERRRQGREGVGDAVEGHAPPPGVVAHEAARSGRTKVSSRRRSAGPSGSGTSACNRNPAAARAGAAAARTGWSVTSRGHGRASSTATKPR